MSFFYVNFVILDFELRQVVANEKEKVLTALEIVGNFVNFFQIFLASHLCKDFDDGLGKASLFSLMN